MFLFYYLTSLVAEIKWNRGQTAVVVSPRSMVLSKSSNIQVSRYINKVVENLYSLINKNSKQIERRIKTTTTTSSSKIPKLSNMTLTWHYFRRMYWRVSYLNSVCFSNKVMISQVWCSIHRYFQNHTQEQNFILRSTHLINKTNEKDLMWSLEFF